jgi:hypothetical protein
MSRTRCMVLWDMVLWDMVLWDMVLWDIALCPNRLWAIPAPTSFDTSSLNHVVETTTTSLIRGRLVHVLS